MIPHGLVHDLAARVEEDGLRRGGALVDGKDEAHSNFRRALAILESPSMLMP